MSSRGLNTQKNSSRPNNIRSGQAPRLDTVAALPKGSSHGGPKPRPTEQGRLTSRMPPTLQQRKSGISSSGPQRNSQNGANLQHLLDNSNTKILYAASAPTLSKVFLGDWRNATSTDSLALADLQLLWKMAGSDTAAYMVMLDDGYQQTVFFKPSHRGTGCACLALTKRLGPNELAFVERKAIIPERLHDVRKLIDAAGWKAGDSCINWANRVIMAAELEGVFVGYYDH